MFSPPIIDLPDAIQMGQTWNRATDWTDEWDFGIWVVSVAVHFEATALVDAYGTLVLPGIGAVTALRVNEIHKTVTTNRPPWIPFGPFAQTNYFRRYFWLVPGVGTALDVLSEGADSVPPAQFDWARLFIRTFEARRLRVGNVRFQFQNNQASLNWLPVTGAGGYRVERTHDVNDTNSNWQLLAEPATNGWTDNVLPGSPRWFYRVWMRP